MKRRGYIISTVLLMIDLLCFAFGGAFIALVAVLYALGIGEYVARVKYRAIPSDPSLGVKHAKLNNCYQRVREKITAEGHHLPNNVKVCLIPGDECLLFWCQKHRRDRRSLKSGQQNCGSHYRSRAWSPYEWRQCFEHGSYCKLSWNYSCSCFLSVCIDCLRLHHYGDLLYGGLVSILVCILLYYQ